MSNIVRNKKFCYRKTKCWQLINNQKIEVAETLTNNSSFASLITVEALKCQFKCVTNVEKATTLKASKNKTIKERHKKNLVQIIYMLLFYNCCDIILMYLEFHIGWFW